MVLLTLLGCGGCADSRDTASVPECWQPLECDGACTTLDEYREDTIHGDLRYWTESRCGDGRTEVSWAYNYGGVTLCFGSGGELVGFQVTSEPDSGAEACYGEDYVGELCDCNADGDPEEAPDYEGECYSALDCGEHCFTLEEQRAMCAANELAFWLVTDATCADGRVEFLCEYGGPRGVRYCFSAEGKLLGARDSVSRDNTCEDFEGELCDCDGDGEPELTE